MGFFLTLLLGSVLLPTSSAETFKIGKIISESDENYAVNQKLYYFDSGVVLSVKTNYSNYIPLIFDGNVSTGIDKDFKTNEPVLTLVIYFPNPLFVNNITVKPQFGGNISQFEFLVRYKGTGVFLAHDLKVEKEFNINCLLDGIDIQIADINFSISKITGHFCLNDVIIEYTPSINNSENIQNQINKINLDISSIKEDIIILKSDIIDIKTNVTNIKNNLPSEYNDSALQKQINNLTQQINSLKENLTMINQSIPIAYNDSTLKSNIFDLESENIFLDQKIGNLTIKLENLTTQINKLESEVQNLKGLGLNEDSETQDGLDSQYLYFVTFGIILIVLLLIILKLSMTIYKRRQHGSERIDDLDPDDKLMNRIEREMKINGNLKDARLYDEKYKSMLDDKFGKGEMSEETYNYIKTVLEVPDKTQDLKEPKT
jgi:predicted  nucleic acid-binding Zn-ribbon protein